MHNSQTKKNPAEAGFYLPNNKLAFAGVVLTPVNLLGRLILLLVDGLAIGSGELAAVRLTHAGFSLVDALLLAFHVASFASGHRTVLKAFTNALLLVALALRDLATLHLLVLGIVFLRVYIL